MPGGSCRCARAIIDCTSCAAASIDRLRSNCSVMLVLPCELRRADRRDAGDRRELLLERRRHRRGHRLRARAGQAGVHLDRGEVDGRQVADRQQPVAHDAEDQDREHEQRRRDGPANEGFREVHDDPSLPAARPPRPRPPSPAASRSAAASGRRARVPRRRVSPRSDTRAPGVSRSCPSVTTTSPARHARWQSPSGRPAAAPILHGPHLDRAVGLDDVDELPVLRRLHGGCRHDERVRRPSSAAA